MTTYHPSARARAQSGVALVIVLILLLVMTLLGLASMRGTLMEERMSANMYDRGLAFQAVEAALREAETRVSTPGVIASFPAAGCTGGLCSRPVVAANSIDRGLDPSFSGWTPASSVVVDGITTTPEYFIEYMGLAPGWPLCDRLKPLHPQCMKPRFRITAQLDTADRAHVQLQANYVAL